MAVKIIVGLAALVAIVLAVAPDANTGGILSMALVALGVAYAVMNVNAEDATGFLALVIASGVAAQADVLSVIPAVGAQLDAVIDGLVTALNSGAIAVLVVWVINRLKG
jgi:hypothetical protein